jgi:FixJ family two-component response regulator
MRAAVDRVRKIMRQERAARAAVEMAQHFLQLVTRQERQILAVVAAAGTPLQKRGVREL